MPDSKIPAPEEVAEFCRKVHMATLHGSILGSESTLRVPLHILRYLIGMIDSLSEGPLTPEQAQAEYDAQADAPPLPEDRIQAIVSNVLSREEALKANARLREENANLLAQRGELISALEPFEIQVSDAKENEVWQVSCGGWHLRAVCAALKKARGKTTE